MDIEVHSSVEKFRSNHLGVFCKKPFQTFLKNSQENTRHRLLFLAKLQATEGLQELSRKFSETSRKQLLFKVISDLPSYFSALEYNNTSYNSNTSTKQSKRSH